MDTLRFFGVFNVNVWKKKAVATVKVLFSDKKSQLDDHFFACVLEIIFFLFVTERNKKKTLRKKKHRNEQRSKNNRTFCRTIVIIECRKVRVSWCREEFEHFFKRSSEKPKTLFCGRYWQWFILSAVVNSIHYLKTVDTESDKSNVNWFFSLAVISNQFSTSKRF